MMNGEVGGKEKDTKAFHETGYLSLKDTIEIQEEVKDFNYYFDYVTKMVEEITSLLGKKSAN